MSMKKLSKKLLAVVAAGAMTMGLAMPVFADGTTTPDNKNNAKKAYVSKTYQTEVKKEMKFNFTATQVTAEGTSYQERVCDERRRYCMCRQ